MTFANPLPWWGLALVVIGAAATAWFAYNRTPLAAPRRAALSALRFLLLLALVLFLLRPVSNSIDADPRNVLVPILVDTSRSMSIEDAPAIRRIDRARQILAESLLPHLGSRYQVEVLGFGETVAPASPETLTASARRSDLEAALASLRDRFRGRSVAGIVLLSDGGDTSGGAERAAGEGPPIFAVGIGARAPGRDREVLSVTAAERILDDSRVDIAVSAVSHGFAGEPIALRLLENGRPIDIRRIVPAADGTPVRAVFQVSPAQGSTTVYRVEIPASDEELVPENNARGVLVQSPTRARRALLIEGAPGYEHSFLKRAWAGDRGLEVDAVAKKGRNEQGTDTFYVQAAKDRGQGLSNGFPSTREMLFAYDALVLGNVEGRQFTREQLEAMRAFVAERGGGLLVLGARSFLRQGLVGTALEEALPLDLSERGSDAVPASAPGSSPANRVTLTPAGETHPVMQLAPDPEVTRKRWAALPALASVASLGRTRPGASVLAVSSGPGGGPRPLLAVQRYGEGRSMVFAGEASWRWRMMMPVADRTFETFWKQTLRWLAVGAEDPTHIIIGPSPVPGEDVSVRIVVRTPAFEPVPDAKVTLRVGLPDGRSESLTATRDIATNDQGGDRGGYIASFRPGASGVYRLAADVSGPGGMTAAASTAVLVGGADLEMTDPRLNLRLLERVASVSGGRLVDEQQLATLGDMLKERARADTLGVQRDLWHTGWSFGAMLMLLAAEWILRRRWGLR